MGKKDTCAVFGWNNDRLCPEKYTVKVHISNTKSEKGDHCLIVLLSFLGHVVLKRGV